MTEAATARTKTQDPAILFGLPHYKIPKFNLPNMEMPAVFREFSEQGVAHAKDVCEKAKAAAEEATRPCGRI